MTDVTKAKQKTFVYKCDSGSNKHKQRLIIVKCENCGFEKEVVKAKFLHGSIAACSCDNSNKFVDKYSYYIGKTIGSLRIKELKKVEMKYFFVCDCSCGEKDIVYSANSILQGVNTKCNKCKAKELGVKSLNKMPEFTQEQLLQFYNIPFKNTITAEKYNNFINYEVNDLIVLKYIPANKELNIVAPRFLCRCSCGRLCLKDTRAIIEGTAYSCGRCLEFLKEKFNGYKKFSDFTQSDLLFLMNYKLPMVYYNSQYSDIKYINFSVGYARVIKFIPGFISEGPLFICKCSICNNLFLAGCSNFISGLHQTCGREKCSKVLWENIKNSRKHKNGIIHIDKQYTAFNKQEEQEYIKKVNDKNSGVIQGTDLFIKCVSGTRYKSGAIEGKILVKCTLCDEEREVGLSDWLYQKDHLSLCLCCKQQANVHGRLKNLVIQYKYKNYKSDKYLYIGKGRYVSGIQYVWIVCKKCGVAIEVDGDEYISGTLFNTCGCFLPINYPKNKPKFLKYDLDSFVKQGHTDDFSGLKSYPTNSLSKNKGVSVWSVECPFCEDRFARDPYTILSNHCSSCGCTSKYLGEEIVHSVLTDILSNRINIDIIYRREKDFDGLLGVDGGLLRYDFYIKNKLNDKVVLIEFNGEQHYSANKQVNITDPIKAAEVFKRIQEHDMRKKLYAENHNYKLLVIRYTKSKEKIKEQILKVFKEENI